MKKDPSIWKGRGLSSSIHVPYSKLILNAIYTVQKSSLSFAFSMHFFPSKRLFIFLLFESGPNPYNSKFTYLLIFLSALGLRCCAWASHCGGFSCCRAWALGAQASVVVAHGLSCSAACGIFPDQGSSLCPLHWQADS